MLNRKKIMSNVFPKVKDLPESATAHIKTEANDGMLLYRQASRYSSGESSFHCLACSTHGKTGEGKPVCTNCGNATFRAVRTSEHEAKVRESIHFVQRVDEYVILSEYDCYSVKSIEEGIKIVAKERFRFVFSETDYGMFCNMHKYVGGGSRDVWTGVKDAVDYRTVQSKVIVDDGSVYENYWIAKLTDMLGDTLPNIQEKLKMAVAGNMLTGTVLPELEFEELDDSIIMQVPVRWHVETQTFPVTDAEGFVKTLSWCSNCEKFYTRYEEDNRYRNSECKMCGDPRHYHSEKDYLFHYISAKETDDGGAVIRVQAAIRDKVFTSELTEGVNPDTEIRLVTKFVNYIYVAANGQIAFFDGDKNEIERLQIQPSNERRHYDSFIFGIQSKEVLQNSKCLKRTGYDLLVNTKVSPKYFEYLRQIPSMEIFAKSKMYMLIQDIMKKEVENLPAFIRGTSKQKSLDKLSKPQLQSLRSQYVTLKHLDAYLQCLSKDPDVFKELEERLRQLGLYPDEYFLLATEFEDENALFPEAIDICCFAQWGNSEGIYLEVNLVTAVDGKCVRKNFATGKTLADDSNAFDRMQYTAGYIYKLFCGTHNVSPRFILVRKNEKPTRELLFARVELEYREYLKQILVHKQARISDNGMDIGLRSLQIKSQAPNEKK